MSNVTVIYPYGVEDVESDAFLKSLASITVGLLDRILDEKETPTIRSVSHQPGWSKNNSMVLTVTVNSEKEPVEVIGLYVPAGKDVPTGHRLLAKWLKELGYSGLTPHKRQARELPPGGFNEGTVVWVRPAHYDYVKNEQTRRTYSIKLS